MNLRNYHALLLDMDGVLYRGHERMPGVAELFAFCDAHAIKTACITNNATMTPAQFADKLAGMGITYPARNIINSPIGTRLWLGEQAPRGTKIFCIGMNGLRSALFDDGYFVESADAPAFVVVGLDTEVTYAKLRQACLLINAGARFIGTNPDVSLPVAEGLVPGCGANSHFCRRPPELPLLSLANRVPPCSILPLPSSSAMLRARLPWGIASIPISLARWRPA